MNKIVYSVITNGVTTISHAVKTSWDSYMFVDQEVENHRGWKIRRITTGPEMGPRMTCKWFKLNPDLLFPNAEYTLWIDGRADLLVDPESLLEHLGDNDIACFRHPERTCIYEEADAVIHLKLDKEDIVNEHMQFYRVEGYPEKNGLHAGGLIIRRNTEAVRKLNKLWWNMLQMFGHRDQLSLDYCAWKLGIKISTIPGIINYSNILRLFDHDKPRINPEEYKL